MSIVNGRIPIMVTSAQFITPDKVAVIGFIGIGATILMYALLKSIERGE